LVIFWVNLLFHPIIRGKEKPGKTEPGRLALILLDAQRMKHLIPVLSTGFPRLDQNIAYAVQKLYVQELLKYHNATIYGYKGGLTSVPAMKRFRVKEPVAGVLLDRGKYPKHALDSSPIVIHPKKTGIKTMMLETEIGFIVGTEIKKPVKHIASLKAYIKSVLPVIEVPDLGYDNIKKITGPDIIASNVGAAAFIVGKERENDSYDLDSVSVILKRDGQIVSSGKGSDTLGSQWQALLWLVNKVLAQGWTIKPGQLLITGALGKMIPAKPGLYNADYGCFGNIVFKIQ
jgi:2-keto-4-pentenoate hydratase